MVTTNEFKELPWNEEIWNEIYKAVHDECKRTKVASKFIPLYGSVSSGELTVPSDSIEPDDDQVFPKTKNIASLN